MKSVKNIRDPIHGTIYLDELELKLVDTSYMQRLRHIKQNGLCYLVYPAMNSTRFEHSLGVMHLAGLMADHLELDEHDKRKLRTAALLHDVGHCAFSHTSDDILAERGYSHEENSSRIIRETEITDILDKHDLDPEEISGLIKGEGDLGKILSSEIDIDRMDYLIRDSYYAGVAYGTIDLERVIYGIKLMGRDLVVKKGSLEAAESLLIGRNLMYQTVYRHHTKRIVEVMFRNALESLLKKGLGYEEFIEMDDIDLVHTLRNSKGYPREVMKRIDERRLFKTFFQERLILIEENFREDIQENKRKIESRICKDLGIKKGFLLIDIPETKMSEFKILVETEGGLKRIDEVSSLAKALEKSEQEKLMFCIYTTPKHLDKIEDFNAETYIEFTQTRLRKFT
ncbi:MAG: HD domain-containing protein [Candidatus Altiarchaeota archaeon]|nr:HD domain-containing protein [Candidatus Altiarchaeota archaeon]